MRALGVRLIEQRAPSRNLFEEIAVGIPDLGLGVVRLQPCREAGRVRNRDAETLYAGRHGIHEVLVLRLCTNSRQRNLSPWIDRICHLTLERRSIEKLTLLLGDAGIEHSALCVRRRVDAQVLKARNLSPRPPKGEVCSETCTGVSRNENSVTIPVRSQELLIS